MLNGFNMNIPSFRTGIRGEYRAKLTDSNGRLKHDSGWRPNMVLDQGPLLMLQASGNYSSMSIGTSDIAVDATQTGLQGTYLADVSYDSYGPTLSTNWVTLPYWVRINSPFTFGTNVGTGAIKEFVMAGFTESSAINSAVIRVVLDTPIIKGASDQLVIEHRIYTYPDVTPISGILDCSGVAYDWEMMYYNVDQLISGNVFPDSGITAFTGSLRTSYGAPVNSLQINGTMPVDIFSLPGGDNPSPNGNWQWSNSSVTDAAVPYRTVTLGANVDNMNTTFDIMYLNHEMNQYNTYGAGRVIKLTRSSDGAPFTKENTHAITLQYRMFLDKYTP